MEDEIQALRERAATALEQALRFVEAGGSPLTRKRVAALVGAAPVATAVEKTVARQCADGSFRQLSEGGADGLDASLSSEISGCVDALGVLADLAALRTTCSERLVEFLRHAQADDGSWRRPGEPSEQAQRVATGLLAGLQARTPFARPGPLASAADFLARAWSPDVVGGGNLPMIATYATCMTLVPHELADEIQQWCGRELERGFRLGTFSAAATVRVLIRCDVAALPGFGVSPTALVDALLDEQGADGGFGAASGPEAAGRLEFTLSGMQALIAVCGSL